MANAVDLMNGIAYLKKNGSVSVMMHKDFPWIINIYLPDALDHGFEDVDVMFMGALGFVHYPYDKSRKAQNDHLVQNYSYFTFEM